jgi:hypothetical protein
MNELKQLIMDIDNLQKSETGFKKLSREELMDTFGGFYKGPISAHIWIKYLIDTFRNRED